MGMKKRIIVLFGWYLLIMLVINVTGCSRLSGPSDEEIIKAINAMELFSGGVEKFTLKSPVIIVEKDMLGRNGAWTVKAKMTYTYMMAGGHETKPVEKVQTFRITKSTDSSGTTVWKAVSGQK